MYTSTAVTPAYAPVAVPLTPRGQTAPRAVEPTEKGELGLQQDGARSREAAPVLQLVRRSAESFAELLKATDDARAAAAFSGFSNVSSEPVGQNVDVAA